MSDTYNTCKAIRSSILTCAAEAMCDTSCSEDYAGKKLRELPETISKFKGFKLIDPSELTESELNELGFGRWEEGNPLRLIPIWMRPFLVDEFVCGCIDSDVVALTKTSELDNDHRFGFLAHGVIPHA